MTTLLESRYRMVLRLLPAYYRREREEEMVEIYLWDVDRETQDQSRPTLGEVASIAALALRTRLGAAGAPRPYDRLGAAVRLFALFAVLLQAASVVVDRVLGLTWAATHGPAQWDMYVSGFTARGPALAVAEVAVWALPLLWTVAYFALLHGRLRLARVSALLAALPTLWPFLAPLVSTWFPPSTAFTTTSALFSWLTALALCAAHHRDAPPASLPVGTPGLAFAACGVVMGASVVLLPLAADTVWAPATCFAVGALGWLLWRARRDDRSTACGAIALAVLGLLLLTVRVAALYPWLGTPVPALVLGGALVQAGILSLLVAVLAVVGGRDLAAAR
ncbi:hypothetical protein SLINC_7866 [Streptomyces lincolnensis]|uniref:Uncharacterized protein n=1 Tax=Streptomyces lincolnensis TaxID=1915 RepID=A0A1B1MN98_STRLN|nr:hypothetical protein [Streptomyces lincolnensis]ANS70090.1 hypothetical protein SLINC_7866 [Streptomyces lincolnensis]AXG58987.1 hypothetical protein SLCG_7832 [Streptomyces lincolnensis]QMV11588.1 hypothetical protein GJU35_41860 [Streptomyces lincolnensis]